MSTTTPPADPRAPLPPAVVILGNDAQLAARPATPVQLAHACLAAGFRAAIPASWGDELVAAATLGVIESRPVRPVIQCACPHVARRMLAVGTELAANLVSLVAPPVAVAKYLRSHSPGGIRVTYVGRCPAASDDSIDARLTPEELLAQLAERGIEILEQPEVFESVIPPDRRRYWSQPGGLPAPDQLWSRTRLRSEALGGEELATEVAERVLSRADVLIDVAVASGCACSGAGRGATVEGARAAIAALEPPRSPTAVIDDRGLPGLDLPIPIVARTVSEIAIDPSTRPATAQKEERTAPPFLPIMPLGTPAPEAHPRRPRLTPPGLAAIAGPQAAPPAASPPPRRRSPTGVVRVVPPGSVPVATDPEGRVLPRAYVARRRSPRGGVPVVSDQALASPPAADAEREIEHSIEPAAEPPRESETVVAAPESKPAAIAAVTPPVRAVAPHARSAASPNAFGPVARSLEYLAANRRLAIVAGITVAVLTLGVAIGYAAGRRGATEQQGASALPTLRVDSSAASAAPGLGASRPATRSQQAGVSSRTAATARGSSRRVATGTTAGTRRDVPTTEPALSASPATPSGAATTSALPIAPATPAVDSAAIRAHRDSVTAVARADSLAAEREAIRREIERRRARMDSLVRAQQGNPPSSP